MEYVRRAVLNNFTWWGYSIIVVLIIGPFLPKEPLGTHLGIVVWALTCVPTAYVDALAFLERGSVSTALRSAWKSAQRTGWMAFLMFFAFIEFYNNVPERIDDLLRRVVEDEQLRGFLTITIVTTPSYVLLWVCLFVAATRGLPAGEHQATHVNDGATVEREKDRITKSRNASEV